MTIDPTEAARIAKGLTKAQRRVISGLSSLRGSTENGFVQASYGGFNSNSAFYLRYGSGHSRRPLVEWHPKIRPLAWRLTETGLAVAEALKAERGA